MHRIKFQNRNALNQAYGQLLDQVWVDSCTVDVPNLCLELQPARGLGHRHRAQAWVRRQRRRTQN